MGALLSPILIRNNSPAALTLTDDPRPVTGDSDSLLLGNPPQAGDDRLDPFGSRCVSACLGAMFVPGDEVELPLKNHAGLGRYIVGDAARARKTQGDVPRGRHSKGRGLGCA